MQYLALLLLAILFVIAAYLFGLPVLPTLVIWALGAGWGYMFAQEEC